ncbi:hypothetical protein SDC9_146962 [bioreactor metagenome]|uniref:Uncharacterized protein n=1 Tax=bioreactor metagenome TaxID=1076179 RepID=A0A645EF78_9ZZZZ
MRHPTFTGTEVLDRRIQIHWLHPLPGQSHDRLRIEVEAAHPALTAHDLAQRLDRIDPETVKRVANAHPQGLEIGPGVGHLASAHPQQGRTGIEHRLAEDHGIRTTGGGLHEARDELGRVLSVGVHRQRVGEAATGGLVQAMQHRTALALIGRQHEHLQPLVLFRQGLQLFGRPIGAAVDHHPYRRPLRACSPHRIKHLGAGVVTWNQHEMRRGRQWHVRRSGDHAAEVLRAAA